MSLNAKNGQKTLIWLVVLLLFLGSIQLLVSHMVFDKRLLEEHSITSELMTELQRYKKQNEIMLVEILNLSGLLKKAVINANSSGCLVFTVSEKSCYSCVVQVISRAIIKAKKKDKIIIITSDSVYENFKDYDCYACVDIYSDDTLINYIRKNAMSESLILQCNRDLFVEKIAALNTSPSLDTIFN